MSTSRSLDGGEKPGRWNLAHVPHLYVPSLAGDLVDVTPDQARHLSRVLKYPVDGSLSYTDGRGLVGEGRWTGSVLRRGEERRWVAPSPVTVAVAPPKSKDRQRLIVEKLAELGVAELVWITTRFGQVPAPAEPRVKAWAVSALEQSRSAFLISVRVDSLADLAGIALADIGGAPFTRSLAGIAVGPEGGWHPDELMERETVSLSDRVLRTETAAIVAGALLRSP